MAKQAKHKGILVGSINGARLYYMLDSRDGESDGLIIDSSGQSRFIDFVKTAAYERGLRNFVTSPFHEFLWGSHSGEKLSLWTSIFITKTRPIPSEMLSQVPVREDFTFGDKKKESVNRKAEEFRNRQKKKFLQLSEVKIIDVENAGFKSIGRSIRRTASSGSFDPNAFDADNDGFVQDSTPWMRPAVRPMVPAMRSVTQAKPKVDELEAIRELLSDQTIEELFDTVESALSLGVTRRTVGVTVGDYESIDMPALMEIRDINPANNTKSKIFKMGSLKLMKTEEHAYTVGRRVLDLALEKADLDSVNEAWADKIRQINDQFTKLSQVHIKAAESLGLLWYETQLGKIVANRRLTEDRKPKDKALLALHQKLIGQIKKSDERRNKRDEIMDDIKRFVISPSSPEKFLDDIYAKMTDAGIDHNPTPSDPDPLRSILQALGEDKAKWRAERDQIYDTYGRAVVDAFDRRANELGGSGFDQLEKDAAQLLVELQEFKSPRQILFEEIMRVFTELGVTFGNEKLSFQLPRRNATDEDRAFVAAAKDMAQHADDVASKYIPDEIIKQINRANRPKGLKIKKVDPSAGHLGLWNKYARTLETDGRESTTVHELMHAAADANPFLNVLQNLILAARQIGLKDETSRAKGIPSLLRKGWEEPKAVPLSDGDLALLIEDEFEDIYAGRIYPDGGAETLTRAFDYLLDPSFREYGGIDFDLIASAFGGLLIAALFPSKNFWS